MTRFLVISLFLATNLYSAPKGGVSFSKGQELSLGQKQSSKLHKKYKRIYPLLVCSAQLIDGNFDEDSFVKGVHFLHYLRDKQFSDLKMVERQCWSALKNAQKSSKFSSQYIAIHEKDDAFTKQFKKWFNGLNVSSTQGKSFNVWLSAIFGFSLSLYKEKYQSRLGLAQRTCGVRGTGGLGVGAGVFACNSCSGIGDEGCSTGAGIVSCECDSCGIGLGLGVYHAQFDELDLIKKNYLKRFKHHDFRKLLEFLGIESTPKVLIMEEGWVDVNPLPQSIAYGSPYIFPTLDQ